MKAPILAVSWDLPESEAEASLMAQSMGLPLLESGVMVSGFCLALSASRWELRPTDRTMGGAIYVDFVAGHAAHRRKYGGGRGQALARAIGLKGGTNPRVLDSTAGLGRDSFVLATLGCEITMFERNPVVKLLLADGLRRARVASELESIVQRMSLREGDGIEFLREGGLNFDVVYLDPMFPARKNSAKVKKEMQAFHRLIGADDDSEELLSAALQSGIRRVVVKRPKGSPVLAGREPHASIHGKSTRYDLYMTG